MLNYIPSESTVAPQLIEINHTTVYLRKDVTKVDREYEDGSFQQMYTYLEAAIPVDEFNKHANILLMEGQRNSEADRLTLMEAFADMYETMLMNLS